MQYSIFPKGCFMGWIFPKTLDDGTEYQSQWAIKNVSRLMLCEVVVYDLEYRTDYLREKFGARPHGRIPSLWLKRLEWFYRWAEMYNPMITYDIERLCGGN